MEVTKLFKEGFNCAQSVFVPFAVKQNIDKSTAFKIMAAYGGGLAHTDNLCGAVTGGLAAIGLQFGYSSAEDKETKENCYRLSRKFLDTFKKECGSLYCTKLIGYNLTDTTQAKQAREAGVFSTKCVDLVKKSTEIIESIISEEK